MSDYVSMKNMKLKNEIMTPSVLRHVRDGNLQVKDLQTEQSPLQEIYRNTYKYIEFPPDLSTPSLNIIRHLNDPNISLETNNLIRNQNAW